MNRMNQKESLANGHIRIRREIATCLICISLLVFTSTIFAVSDDANDLDYEGDNAFCVHDNTLIQRVLCICSQAVSNNLTEAAWVNKLKDMTDAAQTVDVETYLWPIAPFDSVSGAGPYTFYTWCDTWGVCVYFEKYAFASTTAIEDVIDNEPDLFYAGEVLLANQPDDHCWLIGLVMDLAGTYEGKGGATDNSKKLTIMEYNETTKAFLHEYGHTSSHRANPPITDEVYEWPTNNYAHYGDKDIPALREPSFYNLNFMFYNTNCGWDADAKYKTISFPFYYYFPYESYCWDAQW